MCHAGIKLVICECTGLCTDLAIRDRSLPAAPAFAAQSVAEGNAVLCSQPYHLQEFPGVGGAPRAQDNAFVILCSSHHCVLALPLRALEIHWQRRQR